jgi:hypothetical protein
MPQVKVQRRDITADNAAAAIRDALGDGYQVTADGDRKVNVRRNAFIRAQVSMSEEAGGTVFRVRGQGPGFTLLYVTMTAVNNMGIAKRVAAAIEQHAAYRDGNG